MVELAWLWLQNQPTSALSLWFHERVRRLGGRMRKTIIVALARKLLIALWRYTTAGVVIAGRGMLVQPQQAATVCELDLVQHAIGSWKRAQTLDPNQRPENCP